MRNSDKEYWKKRVDFSLIGMSIAEDYGGMGLEYLTCAMMLET